MSGEPVVGGTANPTESFNRSSGPIPKAPTSQSTAMNSKNNETANTAKASGESSKASVFQFWSIDPDLRKKILAGPSSAPPNMDEQKRAQMQQSSLRTQQT